VSENQINMTGMLMKPRQLSRIRLGENNYKCGENFLFDTENNAPLLFGTETKILS
jgi:hypothetical protein